MPKTKTKPKAKSSNAVKKAAPKKATAKKAAAPAKAQSKKAASKVKPAKAAAPKATAKKAAAPKKAAAKKPVAKKAAPKATAKKAVAPAKVQPKKTSKAEAKTAAKSPKSKAVQPEVKAKASKKDEAPKKAKPVEVEVVEELDEDLVEEFSPLGPEASEEVILTDAEGRRYCRVRDCDQLSSVDGYCRYHYLLFWKRIQVRKKILTEGKLERYVEDLTGRYPDKFLEMLRKDLRSEKEFLAAIQELEIDEGAEDGDFEDEDQSFIDEVRGMSETSGGREDEDY